MTMRFSVDLDLLDEVVRSLGQHHDQLELLDARLAEVVRRLHGGWEGAAAYAYVLDMVATAQQDDAILTPGDSVTLAIDPKAINILRGTEIDLVQEGLNRVVKFKNPNVVAECGCGESFSVA